MSKPVLAIQLEWGFHEIKKYIHSGFAKKLAAEFDLVWFAVDKGNSIFHRYFQETGFPIVYYKQEVLNKPSSFLERWNHAVRQAWMKRQNLGTFHNYKQITNAGWKDKFFGNSLLKKMMGFLVSREVQSRYIHPQMMNDFRKYSIRKVLSTGYESPFAKEFFTTAHHLGIPCFYLVNSWKDLYVNDFVPFSFLERVMVWDENMKQKYQRHMPHLHSSTYSITGNPTFDVFIHYQPSKDRSYYADKYNLSLNASWLLYTMMPPGIVNDEIDTIKKVGHTLLTKYNKEQLEILVRKNPNHSQKDFSDLVYPANTHLVDHFCTYDSKSDMIVQTEEGEREWLDLVFHCQANLSVPSTVTLEFQAVSKPVINIEFDPSGQRDERVLQHFNAGFYRDLFKREDIIRVSSIDELIPVVEQVRNRTSSDASSFFSASEKILKVIT